MYFLTGIKDGQNTQMGKTVSKNQPCTHTNHLGKILVVVKYTNLNIRGEGQLKFKNIISAEISE